MLFKWLGVAGLVVGLSGCSGLAKWYNGDQDHRINEAQLAKALEVPPAFVKRGQTTQALTAELELAQPAQPVSRLPSLDIAGGARVESNLVERWLVLEAMEPNQAWLLMKQFIQLQGFDIDEQRVDLGLIKTKYKARKELAPVEQELGALTRMFNAWRPELAAGIYDRFSFQLVSAEGQTRVYVRHHMMLANSSGDTTEWSMRPYDPMVESLTLYQLLRFVGVTQQAALAQIAAQPYYQEIAEGEELAGLVLNAGLTQSWDYLQSLIFRADWQVISQDSNQHLLWLKLPDLKQNAGGFFSRLFATPSQPGLVQIKLASYESSTDRTLLSFAVEEGQPPLKAEQRRKLLEQLGLLAE